MSEQMTSGWPPALRIPPSGMPIDSMLKWHRNLPSGTAFEKGQISLDFSLELMEGIRNHAIANGDSVLAKAYKAELADMLGFEPKDRNAASEEEAPAIQVDEGLTGRNLWVFIGFILLILVLGGLLVWNFIKK